MRGFETHIAEGRNRTAILTKKKHTTQQHQVCHRIEHTLIEKIPQKKTAESLYPECIQPALGQPKGLGQVPERGAESYQRAEVTCSWELQRTARIAYHKTNKKGTDVDSAAQHHQLTLWNDPQCPTRIGSSISRDTSPDLTLSKSIRQIEWARLEETMGCDHYIIQTELRHNKTPLRTGQAKITNWTAFRKGEHPVDMDDIEEWTRQVMEEVTKHTKTIQLISDNPEVDPHFLHLWEARRSGPDHLKRWKKQKRNRKLKIRIALLSRQAEEYAERLGIQNWNQVYDRLPSTLSNRRTWAILKSLLAKTESKNVTGPHIQRLISNYQGSEEDEQDTSRIIQALVISKTTYRTPYLGLKNSEREKINTLIRRTYKLALGLSPTTSTEKLLRLGIHNTSEDLAEAHNVSRVERLQLTRTGREALRRLGYAIKTRSRDYSLQARDKAEHGTCLKAKATDSIHCTINFGVARSREEPDHVSCSKVDVARAPAYVPLLLSAPRASNARRRYSPNSGTKDGAPGVNAQLWLR
ncbi:hypothetical protein HPB47_028111 [Ixodes persulcatus]|uniref:Uncharacterized protein n=1 Tax=Ixodes persulcatus TaxID=34615 RepID=A0AC60PU54_IXOPE|nr:hypothetical protein HPB47_028111 [Ixodes persulcatus]